MRPPCWEWPAHGRPIEPDRAQRDAYLTGLTFVKIVRFPSFRSYATFKVYAGYARKECTMPHDPTAVDLLSLASASLLVQEALKATAGEAGKRVWGGLERFSGAVRQRLSASGRGSEVLELLETHPADDTTLVALVNAIEGEIERDPDFRSQLAAIAANIGRPPSITASDTGVVAGGNITISGHNVAARDLSIGETWANSDDE
jgi:hypothetical protein